MHINLISCYNLSNRRVKYRINLITLFICIKYYLILSPLFTVKTLVVAQMDKGSINLITLFLCINIMKEQQ